jgi:hypothetical protein
MKRDSEEEAEIRRLRGYAMQLEAEVRTLKSDIEFLKRGHRESIDSINSKISKLERKNAELLKELPLTFDKHPFSSQENTQKTVREAHYTPPDR